MCCTVDLVPSPKRGCLSAAVPELRLACNEFQGYFSGLLSSHRMIVCGCLGVDLVAGVVESDC